MGRAGSRKSDCSRKRHELDVTGSLRKAAVLLAGTTAEYVGHSTVKIYKQRGVFRNNVRSLRSTSKEGLLEQLEKETKEQAERLYLKSDRIESDNGTMPFPCLQCDHSLPTVAEHLFHHLAEHNYRKLASSPLQLYLLPETWNQLGATLHAMYSTARKSGYQEAVGDALENPANWYGFEWEMLVQRIKTKLEAGETAATMRENWKH